MLDPEVGLGLASGDRVGPSSLTLWGLPLPRPLPLLPPPFFLSLCLPLLPPSFLSFFVSLSLFLSLSPPPSFFPFFLSLSLSSLSLSPPSSFPLFLHRILFTFVRAAEHTPVSQRSLACLIPALGLLGACAQHRSRGEEADCRAGSQPRGPQAFFCACSSAPLPVTTWSSLLLLSEDFEASKWRVVLLAVQGANPPSSACLLPSLPSFARCPLATCPGLSLVPHVHYCSRNLLSHSSKCLNGSFSLGVACGILVL